jgi:DNA-binding response OmpR family regulator
MIDRKALILMVEDDEAMARLNARMLKRQGYEVLIALNAGEARMLARDNSPDLFVLDVMLPDGDGFSLCEEIRKGSDAPILFLTGRRELEDRLAGISTGGDYYLTKPYEMDEFVAVATRLLQKAEQQQSKLDKAVRESMELTRGPLTLKISESRAFVNGRDAELTPIEFALLLMLARNADKAFSSEEIYKSVWNAPMTGDTQAVKSAISRLRKKLEGSGYTISSVRGEGYLFERGSVK